MAMNTGNHFIRALNHTLIMLTAMILTLFMWFSWRIPDGSVILVNTALMASTVTYDQIGYLQRLKTIGTIVFWVAVLQFAAHITYQKPLLQIIAFSYLIYLMLRLVRNKSASSVAMILGCIALFTPGGYLKAAYGALDLLIAFAGAGIASLLVSLVHLPSVYSTIDQVPYAKREAFKVVIQIGIGVFIVQISQQKEAVWWPLSIAFVYFALQLGRELLHMAGIRIISTLLGVYAGFLFMGCWCYYNYRMIYTLPIFAGFAFFALYYFKNYFVYSIVFLLCFCVYSDYLSTSIQTVNLFEMACVRWVYSVLGILSVLLFEELLMKGGAPENVQGNV